MCLSSLPVSGLASISHSRDSQDSLEPSWSDGDSREQVIFGVVHHCEDQQVSGSIYIHGPLPVEWACLC